MQWIDQILVGQTKCTARTARMWILVTITAKKDLMKRKRFTARIRPACSMLQLWMPLLESNILGRLVHTVKVTCGRLRTLPNLNPNSTFTTPRSSMRSIEGWNLTLKQNLNGIVCSSDLEMHLINAHTWFWFWFWFVFTLNKNKKE